MNEEYVASCLEFFTDIKELKAVYIINIMYLFVAVFLLFIIGFSIISLVFGNSLIFFLFIGACAFLLPLLLSMERENKIDIKIYFLLLFKYIRPIIKKYNNKKPVNYIHAFYKPKTILSFIDKEVLIIKSNNIFPFFSYKKYKVKHITKEVVYIHYGSIPTNFNNWINGGNELFVKTPPWSVILNFKHYDKISF